MSFEEPSKSADEGFTQYKQTHEGAYSAEKLVHYFNTEMGMASNLLNTLRAEIKSGRNAEGASSNDDEVFNVIGEHLANAHEIANIMAELIHRAEKHL